MNGCSCRPASRSNGWLLGLGLVGGVIGGVVLARKMADPTGMLPAGEKMFSVWQRELAKTGGVVEAGFTSARIRDRYAELHAHRPPFQNSSLRQHLDTNILPGLALYQILLEIHDDQREQALAEFDRLMEAQILESPLNLMGRLLGLMPDPFATFRWFHNLNLSSQYPAEGWDFQWVENTPDAVAYNCTHCFYQEVLRHYGAPELTSHFCRLDDLMFERFPYFVWKRTKTLGRGDDCCNFRFERMKTTEA